MKTPICAFDAKTGILCPICEGKLRDGHLTRADVDASIQLVRLAENLPELNRISLQRALEAGADFVLVLGAGDVTFLQRESHLIRRIEEQMKRRVWLVDGEASDRKLLENLFFPVHIVTVNTVWLPDGSKLTKTIITGRQSERSPVDISAVKTIVKALRGIELLVEFEKQ